MNVTTKHIEIVPYDPAWVNLFENEAKTIKEALGDNCITIYHVGSTSVPGLYAKPTIDIIAVVKDPQQSINSLEKAGYIYKGEWNIPFKYGFTKRDVIKINLHAFEENHPEIEANLLFRDYLRQHLEARDEYARLKEMLLKNPSSFEKKNSLFAGYTLGKGDFINRILKESGFNRLRFLKCAHYTEWEAYHQIRDEQIFSPIYIDYDRNHPTITAENHFHFVLCQGTQIVSTAHVEFLNAHEAALRTLATDAPFQNQGFGKALVTLLERWVKLQGREILKTHARLKAEDFYRRLGYNDMPFDDPCIEQDYINLGKIL